MSEYFIYIINTHMNIYDFCYTDTKWKEISLSDYHDYVILIVNTATWCWLASQLLELEKLYQKYKSQKFIIIWFPCNQFANQEPVFDEDMTKVCLANYGVTFPLSSKIYVNGKNTHPIFKYLKDKISNWILGKVIKWNFTKFLIDREGQPIQRFAPTSTPKDINEDIKKLLNM